MLSVIIPAYNEEQMIPITSERINSVLSEASIPYEIIFVDDGSKDKTWSEITDASQKKKNIRGVHFSRNFGKEAAMFAGLENADGACAVIIDCDLQHPPEKIVDMYRLWEEGYEVVEGIKDDRGRETKSHNFAASLFYKLISRSTGFDMSNSSDFKLIDRKVIDTLNSLPERGVFFRALSYWVGYKKTEVHYVVQERIAGETKWGFKSLVRYALNNITSFSSAPLHIITILGIVMLIVSCILGIICLVQKISGAALEGFTTVILIQLFGSSIVMISLGIIGYYISKIYEEVKGRPKYIVSEVCGKKVEK